MSEIMFGSRTKPHPAKPEDAAVLRIGGGSSARVCQLPPPPPEPKVFRAEAHRHIENDGHYEIVTGRGESAVSQEEAKLAAQEDLVAKVAEHTKRLQAELAKEEEHAASVDPAVHTEITILRGQAQTDLFLANHPEFHRCTQNQRIMEDAVRELGAGWNSAQLEKAYERVKDSLVTADGRTNREVREHAEQEARMRPRRADVAATLPTPSPEQIEHQKAEALRAEDLRVVQEFEALPMVMQRRHIKNRQRIALRYDVALERLNPRRTF